MRRLRPLVFLLLAAPVLNGCLAIGAAGLAADVAIGTVGNTVEAAVGVTGAAIDLVTPGDDDEDDDR